MSRTALLLLAMLAMSACVGQQALSSVPEPPGHQVESCGWAEDPSAVECFIAALDSGRGAEIFLELTTIEGDPIYQIARAMPDGNVEIYTDSSQDTHIAIGQEYSVVECDSGQFRIDSVQSLNGMAQIFTGDCESVRFGW